MIKLWFSKFYKKEQIKQKLFMIVKLKNLMRVHSETQ